MEQHQRQVEAGSLFWYQNCDGMWVIYARLPQARKKVQGVSC